MLFVGAAAQRLGTAVRSFVGRVTRSRFGYDVADQAGNGRRRAPSKDMRHEDGILQSGRRRQVQSSARDAVRNFTVAGFMARKHLDYTTRFNFQGRTGNDDFDEALEKLVASLASPERFDLSGRFCLSECVRNSELSALLDGDILWVKLATGHVQVIESDLIRDRQDDKSNKTEKTINGVVVDGVNGGRHDAYAIHSRPDTASNQYKFERMVPAKNCFFHGYVHRFDQVRGISPLAPGLNSLQDVYEGIDYCLAKLKAESLFGLKFTRSATESAGTLRPEGDDDDEGYSVVFGKGPVQLDLERGDDAEFMQSNTPGAQSQDFLNMIVSVAMKALDMPFSFFDESFTNFFGSRAAWTHYDNSCGSKRDRIRRLLVAWTLWRLTLAIADGELVVPEGMELSEDWFEWVPEGMAWWDPVKEVEADKSACMAGFADPEKVTRKRAGGDIYRNLRSMARVKSFAESLGISLSWAPIPQPVEVVEKDPE